MYISLGSSNSQWLWSAVTNIPCFLKIDIKSFISSCKITVSPKLRVLPLWSGDSNENSAANANGEWVGLPNIVALISLINVASYINKKFYSNIDTIWL